LVGSVFARATLLLAAFLAGCPEADQTPAAGSDGPPATAVFDAAVAVPDTAATVDSSDGSLAPETAADAAEPAAETAGAALDAAEPDAIEQMITVIFAASDLPPQFICLGGFADDDAGAPYGDPIIAGGPFGIPDSTDPARKRLSSGFPYGAVISLPLRRRDAKFTDDHAPIGFIVDDVSPREFLGSGIDSDICKRAWPAARDVPARQVRFRRGELKKGESWLAGITSCAGVSGSACGSDAATLQTSVVRLDVAAPTMFAGQGDLTLGVQAANLATVGALQDLDFYLQPMRVEAGSKVADGAPLALHGGSGLARGQLAEASAGVRLTQATASETLLLLAPHGTAPCLQGDDCHSLAVPIEPFRARLASPQGGATGAAWSGNQVLAIFGRPPASVDEMPPPLRIGMFLATFDTR
jgi:hypothetical protein